MLIVVDPLSGFYFCFENVFQENYIFCIKKRKNREREQSSPVLGCKIITTPIMRNEPFILETATSILLAPLIRP